MNTLLKGLFIFPLLLILGTSGCLAGDSEDAAFDLCIEQEEAKVVSYEGTKEWPAMRDAFLEKCGAFFPSQDDEDYERGQADERAQIYKEHRQAVYDSGRASIRESHNAKVENARRLAELEQMQADWQALTPEQKPGYQKTISCTVVQLNEIVGDLTFDCGDNEEGRTRYLHNTLEEYPDAVMGGKLSILAERQDCVHYQCHWDHQRWKFYDVKGASFQ